MRYVFLLYKIENFQLIRFNAAKKLQDIGTKCQIAVDRMDNQANSQFRGLFERLYIILDDVVVYAGERGPMNYRYGVNPYSSQFVLTCN